METEKTETKETKETTETTENLLLKYKERIATLEKNILYENKAIFLVQQRIQSDVRYHPPKPEDIELIQKIQSEREQHKQQIFELKHKIQNIEKNTQFS